MKKQIEKYYDILRDKSLYVDTFLSKKLCELNQMFEWRNLPNGIPSRQIEVLLQTNGTLFFTDDTNDNGFQMLLGFLGGEIDAYYRLSKYSVANVALKLSKFYDIEKDGVLIRNDINGSSVMPILMRYAQLNCEVELSLLSQSILNRAHYIISASDDRTRASAELFLKRIEKGDFSVIGDSEFFNGVKTQSIGQAGANNISQLKDLWLALKAQCYNEFGLAGNSNPKKERVTESEENMNNASLLPYCENMLACRKEAVERINERYGLNIEVDFAGAWKAEQEAQEVKDNETGAEVETDTGATQSDGNNIETNGRIESETTKIEAQEKEALDDEQTQNEKQGEENTEIDRQGLERGEKEMDDVGQAEQSERAESEPSERPAGVENDGDITKTETIKETIKETVTIEKETTIEKDDEEVEKNG